MPNSNSHNAKHWIVDHIISGIQIVLTIVVLAKLGTTPSMVRQEVMERDAELKVILTGIASTQETHAQNLALQESWTRELALRIDSNSLDRWTGTQARTAWQQFIDDNPSLQVPPDFEPFKLKGEK